MQMLDSRGSGGGDWGNSQGQDYGNRGQGGYNNANRGGGYGNQGGDDYGYNDYGNSGGGNQRNSMPNKPVPPQNDNGGFGGPALDQDTFDDDIPF